MASASTLPVRPLPVLDPDGTFSLPWYRKLQELSQAANGSVDPAIIAAIEAEIATLQAEVAFLQTQLATAKTLRYYGSYSGRPDAGMGLFESGLEMDGDEIFAGGLSSNLFSLGTASAAASVWPVTVNGIQLGQAMVSAGAVVGTWSMTSQYAAARGDILNFLAPNPQDATAANPRYTFIGTRS